MNRFLSASLFVFAFSAFAAAQEEPAGREIADAAGLRVRLIDADGTPLQPLPVPAFQAELAKLAENETLYGFEYKEQRVFVKTKTAEKSVSFQTESPLFADGKLSIGILAAGDKHQPQTTVKENSVEFKLSRSKRTLEWTGKAAFIAPKPRKKLDISLAEYGATDKWKDATALITRLQIGDAVQFNATNVFFGGDPAPGIVKNLVLTYSLDGEEQVQTLPENANVRIQYNPKDYYFRLSPKSGKSFEFKVLY
jgi:hypothetical protein